MLPSRIPKTLARTKRKPDPKRAVAHLSFVRGVGICLCCGVIGLVQAAHVRAGTDGGTGTKPSDKYTVPLCDECHRIQHNKGELTFWGDLGTEPLNVSLRLWTVSGDLYQGRRVIERDLARRGIYVEST